MWMVLFCFLHTSIVALHMSQSVCGCMCVSARDICRLESHVLHIPTCPALTALRDGMGKLYAYNARPGKSSLKIKGGQYFAYIHKKLVIKPQKQQTIFIVMLWKHFLCEEREHINVSRSKSLLPHALEIQKTSRRVQLRDYEEPVMVLTSRGELKLKQIWKEKAVQYVQTVTCAETTIKPVF